MPIKRFTKMSSIPELWKFVVASLPVAPAVIELGKDALQALYFQLQSNPIVVNATLSAGGFTILYALYSRLKGPEDGGEQLEPREPDGERREHRVPVGHPRLVVGRDQPAAARAGTRRPRAPSRSPTRASRSRCSAGRRA